MQARLASLAGDAGPAPAAATAAVAEAARQQAAEALQAEAAAADQLQQRVQEQEQRRAQLEAELAAQQQRLAAVQQSLEQAQAAAVAAASSQLQGQRRVGMLEAENERLMDMSNALHAEKHRLLVQLQALEQQQLLQLHASSALDDAGMQPSLLALATGAASTSVVPSSPQPAAGLWQPDKPWQHGWGAAPAAAMLPLHPRLLQDSWPGGSTQHEHMGSPGQQRQQLGSPVQALHQAPPQQQQQPGGLGLPAQSTAARAPQPHLQQEPQQQQMGGQPQELVVQPVQPQPAGSRRGSDGASGASAAAAAGGADGQQDGRGDRRFPSAERLARTSSGGGRQHSVEQPQPLAAGASARETPSQRAKLHAMQRRRSWQGDSSSAAAAAGGGGGSPSRPRVRNYNIVDDQEAAALLADAGGGAPGPEGGGRS